MTGASSGIGAAVARRFARDGDRVVVAARRLDRLQALAAEFGGEFGAECGGKVLPIALDVSDRAAVERAIATLPSDFAAIDVLVNDAGLALGLEPAHQADLDEWERMIDVNVKGLVYCTRTILPGMVARDRGHVINIGSVAASYPYPGGNVYAGTKAFVAQFGLDLRADLLGKRVRVTTIEPGMVETEFSVVRFRGDADRAAKVYQGVEVLSPDDVAETVRWVATLPPHVNVNRLEVMPVMQAFGPFAVQRS